jgi:hypothetical protein
MSEALGTIACYDEDAGVEGWQLRFGNAGFSGNVIESLGFVHVMHEAYLSV